ncbi:histone-lysine N-methyltransferase SETMAR [Elysia marginata]|uniref:Histone-lysine N-methyltransferase SETMAR n=1 Tax=Elysia marginata TaxID=1093978 RepID=A0AAV4F5Y3_9GAST|nr:histone-lysine N-methyltransferase SETMAR [Elysia marginata]
MLTVFWDSEGIVHKGFLKQGNTVNSERYISTLRKLSVRLKRVRPTKHAILHQDNARPHTSRQTLEKLHKMNFFVLPHPSHNPDLAPTLRDVDELNQNTWVIAVTVVAVVVTGAAAIVIGLLVWRLHRNKFPTASNNAAGREIELRPRCNVPVEIRERRDEQETTINRRSVQGHEPAEIGTQNVHMYDEAGDHYASSADIMRELEAPSSPTVTSKTGSLIQDGNKREPKCHVDTEEECGANGVPMLRVVKLDPSTGGPN